LSDQAPLPDDEPAPEGTDESPFYRGTIVSVQYGRGTGVLRTGSGRELRFAAPTVEFFGGRRIYDLAAGMEVGYDVGRTSHGLQVIKIKIW